ncbi:MAG: DUF4142 domain-containing protein [Candidatus Binataceae bacterium]
MFLSKWLKGAVLAASIPAAIFFLAPATVHAQTAAPQPGKTSSKHTGVMEQSHKQQFGGLMMYIHDVDQQEIVAGRLAEKKGTTSSIRDYGKMLVHDHQQADREVKTAARHLDVKITASADRAQHLVDEQQAKDLRHKLKRASGSQFDQDFLTAMKSGHEPVIDRLKSARQSTSNTQVDNLLDKLIPVLEQHEDVAQKLSQNPHANISKV